MFCHSGSLQFEVILDAGFAQKNVGMLVVCRGFLRRNCAKSARNAADTNYRTRPRMLLALVIAQSANVGVVLATRGAFTYMGWDGAAKKNVKLGEPLAPADEISTEGDGLVKVSLAEVAVITLGPSTKITFATLAGNSLVAKVGYGRVRAERFTGAANRAHDLAADARGRSWSAMGMSWSRS